MATPGLSPYLDKRREVQENTSMRSSEFPRVWIYDFLGIFRCISKLSPVCVSVFTDNEGK